MHLMAEISKQLNRITKHSRKNKHHDLVFSFLFYIINDNVMSLVTQVKSTKYLSKLIAHKSHKLQRMTNICELGFYQQDLDV